MNKINKPEVDTIRIRLVKSLIGTKKDHRATVRGLGLRRINSVSVLESSASVLGMINKVNYLLKIEA